MKTVVELTTVEKKKYIAADGKVFLNEEQAKLHEKKAEIRKEIEKLPRVRSDVDGRVYFFCKEEKDYDLLVKWLRYQGAGELPKNILAFGREWENADWYTMGIVPSKEGRREYICCESLTQKRREWRSFLRKITTVEAGVR